MACEMSLAGLFFVNHVLSSGCVLQAVCVDLRCASFSYVLPVTVNNSKLFMVIVPKMPPAKRTVYAT